MAVPPRPFIDTNDRNLLDYPCGQFSSIIAAYHGLIGSTCCQRCNKLVIFIFAFWYCNGVVFDLAPV